MIVRNEWDWNVVGRSISRPDEDSFVGIESRWLRFLAQIIDAPETQIELLNLAGPRTGLDMMEPVGRTMPTTNFFSFGGYWRNTIVRDKTAAELLAALDERIEINLKKSGSIEFAAAFDEALRAGRKVGNR